MPIGEFLGFAYSNIGKKDALWIGVIAKSGKQDDPVNVDKDNFKINVLPRFINAGFQRVILSVGNETYDTDKDPFMKRLIEDLKNEKRKYWTSALQYGKQLKKYSLEKRDPNSWDVLEQNGYMDSVSELTKPPFDKPVTFVKLFDTKTRSALIEILNRVKTNALHIAG